MGSVLVQTGDHRKTDRCTTGGYRRRAGDCPIIAPAGVRVLRREPLGMNRAGCHPRRLVSGSFSPFSGARIPTLYLSCCRTQVSPSSTGQDQRWIWAEWPDKPRGRLVRGPPLTVPVHGQPAAMVRLAHTQSVSAERLAKPQYIRALRPMWSFASCPRTALPSQAESGVQPVPESIAAPRASPLAFPPLPGCRLSRGGLGRQCARKRTPGQGVSARDMDQGEN